MRFRQLSGVLGFAGLLAQGIVCFNATRAFAAEAPAEKAKITFAPEVEKKLTDFFTKLKEAKRKHGVTRMQKLTEEIVKATGLVADSAKTLEKSAEQAVALSTEIWIGKSEDLWRKQMNQAPEELIDGLEEALPQIEMYAQGDFFGGDFDPDDQAVWTEALQRVLTPEQRAVWEKAQLERKQTLGKEFADVVKRSVEGIRERQLQVLLARTGDIKQNLRLSEERGKKLDDLARRATDQAAEAWQARAEKTLLTMPEVQRKQIAKQGNFYLGPDEADTPERQPAWKDGLAELLSPEESKRLEGVREEKKSRRAAALGRVMLALLDEEVAFTAAQRERLTPITERIAKAEATFFPENSPGDYFSFSPHTFLNVATKAAPKELEEILDPIQRQHWQEAAKAKPDRMRGVRIAGRRAAAETKPAAPEREPEPEQFEHIVSNFLYEKAEAERKRVAGVMTLKAEDAARVSSLAAEGATRLKTAARGAAEEALASWKSMTEESLRSNLSEATAKNVKQRLEGMEDYQFRRGSNVVPEKRPVWEQTVRTVLNDEQRAAWHKEVDARSAYRDKAIAALVLAEFERKHFLSAEEWPRLEALVTSFLKEYGPDIGTMFSPYNSTPWFLQSYTMFIPFASIPEKDLKEILGKERWEQLIGSNEFSNTSHYWENIRNNHERRVKEVKK